MLTFMEPKFLRDYQRLIEKDLQNQLLEHEKRVSSMPTHLKQATKNLDVRPYLVSNDPPQNEHETMKEENPLMIQIKKYSSLKNTQQKKPDKQKKSAQKLQSKGSRKARTYITIQKLKLMNQLFMEFLEPSRSYDSQDSNQQRRNTQGGIQSLKDICKILDLGYSAVSHKFKQFKATYNLKPGARILSTLKKGNYKKSLVLQDILRTCLQERIFYSAIEIQQYIKQKYKQNYSRPIIARNLRQMGYSKKHLANYKKQLNQIKMTRKIYAIAFQTLNIKHNCEVYYLDQFVFKFEGEKQIGEGIEIQDEAQKQIHVIVLASKKEIIRYELSPFAINQTIFTRLLKGMKEYFESNPRNPRILVLDLDRQLHFNEKMQQTRMDLKKQNLKMLYLPPNSHKMSLLQWSFNQIQQQLKTHKFREFQQFKETIEKMIQEMEEQKLQKHYQTSLDYIKLSLQNQNF